MRPFAVLDSETDPFRFGRIPAPFLWGFYDGISFRHYLHESFSQFIEWVSEQKIIIYAHNGGKFDYHFMLDYLAPYDSIKIINGRIASFFIGKAEFRDSYNILPVPLKSFELVGADGGVIKKQEFDYDLMEKENRYKPDIWEKIIDYLRDDCVTLYNAVKQFQGEYGRHLTQAGAAMAQWRKISKKDIPESSQDFFNDFKRFYYGGRVQCFKTGIIEKDFSVFDINSAYPYAMLSRHAYGLSYTRSLRENPAYPRESAFFRIRAASLGAFPYREKSGLTFPADGEIREFFITGWELIAAENTNTAHSVEIIEVFYFHELSDFSEYINHFYSIRMNAKASGDKANDLFAKLLMNSLYGKFGSNPENYTQNIIVPKEKLLELSDYDSLYKNGGELGPWILGERDLESDEMRFYNVATAASITGFVRAYLWQAIVKTGLDNILYCDTDSIATISTGDELDTGKALGQWKFEGDFDKAGIGGKKLYIFRGKKDAKGNREYKTASKGARLTHDQLWKVARGEGVEYRPENPSFSVHTPPKFVTRRISLTA